MSVRKVFDPELGRDLIIDPEIPGQIGWEGLLGIAHVAARVPKGGVVVEVGSLFGRSSYIWGMNTDPTTKVYCLDPWVREYWIVEAVEKPQKVPVPFSIDAHRYYTRDCPNIVRMQGYSPDVAKGWSLPIDVYFEDSDHSKEALDRNFGFWEPWVKPGGFICGDEFHPDYPATLAKIASYEEKWGTKAQNTSLFWWMQKPVT